MAPNVKSLIDHTIQHAILGVTSGGGGGGVPTAHALRHKHGGVDEVATGTPTANAIPKADAGGKLDVGWLPAASLPKMYVVADEAARLALTVEEGDEAKQLDTGKHWIYDGSDWFEYPDTQLGPHSLGGVNHTADTLASLNTKVSDATLIDTGDSRLSDARVPTTHATSHENGGGDEISVAGLSGELADKQPVKAHDLAGSDHNADTLANLNTKISDANLIDTGDSRLSDARTPTSHASSHNAGGGDALAIDAAAAIGSLRTVGTGALQACAGNDSRLSDSRTPTGHASSHQNGGADEIATATPTANSIPKTAGSTTLDAGWVADGSDGTAIHDNVNGEVNAITEKVTPVDDDVLILEDSAASYAKKKVKISSLPGGSVFGTEYESAVSEGESTTTSLTYVPKLSHTTPTLPAGDYLIQWNWEIKTTNGAKAVLARVELDDTTELAEDGSLLTIFDETSGFAVVTLTNATHQIDIDFKVVSGATATLRRARLTIWRLS